MKFVWQLLAIMAISLIGGQGVMALAGMPWLQLVAGIVTCVLAVLVYRFVVGRTEHRPVAELSGDKVTRRVGLGFLVGVAVFGAVIVNIAFLGFYQVEGMGSWTGAVGLFGFMAAAATTEELLFRGVLFRKVEEWTGTWIALVATSAVFGLGHLLNPNASLWGAIVIALTGGAMLTAAYIATRNLWLPIGLHFGWNFAAGGIFSTEVSGNNTPPGLLDSTTSGPVLITGGDFGPEASIYTLVAWLLVTVGLLLVAHRRGHVIPRRRSDRVQPVGQPAGKAVDSSDEQQPSRSVGDTDADDTPASDAAKLPR